MKNQNSPASSTKKHLLALLEGEHFYFLLNEGNGNVEFRTTCPDGFRLELENIPNSNPQWIADRILWLSQKTFFTETVSGYQEWETVEASPITEENIQHLLDELTEQETAQLIKILGGYRDLFAITGEELNALLEEHRTTAQEVFDFQEPYLSDAAKEVFHSERLLLEEAR